MNNSKTISISSNIIIHFDFLNSPNKFTLIKTNFRQQILNVVFTAVYFDPFQTRILQTF